MSSFYITNTDVSATDPAYDMGSTRGEEIFVSSSGKVIGSADNILLTGNANAQSISVYGELHTGANYAVDIVGSYSFLNVGNTGTISNLFGGGNFAAVRMGGDGTIQNSGEIAGDLGLIAPYGGLVLDNIGTISSLGYTLYLFTAGVTLGSDSSLLDESNTIENHGFIGGTDYSIFSGVEFYGAQYESTDTVMNYGTLSGDVWLGGLNDTLTNDGLIVGDVLLGTGHDMYMATGNGMAGTVYGEAGYDTLYGAASDDTLDGGSGGDLIKARGGNDLLIGGTGRDTLIGNSGNDVLQGKGGSDLLKGGSGNDTLTGDGGKDSFRFIQNAGDNVITDFTNGQDKIDLRPYGLPNFAAISGAISDAGGGDTYIDLDAIGGSGSILLEGFSYANIDASDFVF